jgi:hypothetical protein
MNLSTAFFPLMGAFFFGQAAAQVLNATAISAAHGASTLECWQFSATASKFAGATNYPIGDFEGAYIGVISPKTYIGQAWAPHVQ